MTLVAESTSLFFLLIICEIFGLLWGEIDRDLERGDFDFDFLFLLVKLAEEFSFIDI
jgi:hypothetical protein